MGFLITSWRVKSNLDGLTFRVDPTKAGLIEDDRASDREQITRSDLSETNASGD